VLIRTLLRNFLLFIGGAKDSHLYYYLILQQEHNPAYLINLFGCQTFGMTILMTHVCIENCSRFLTKSAFMTLERSLLGLSTVRAVSVRPGHKVITVTPVFS